MEKSSESPSGSHELLSLLRDGDKELLASRDSILPALLAPTGKEPWTDNTSGMTMYDCVGSIHLPELESAAPSNKI